MGLATHRNYGLVRATSVLAVKAGNRVKGQKNARRELLAKTD